MDSAAWLGVLREAAENIYISVSEARFKGVGLENREFKHLLDEAAQRMLIEMLEGSGVSATLISEEGNATINGGGATVIADPVDGTTNLARGIYPAVTCLSASETDRHTGTVAAVVKNLYTGDVYTAERGRGATLKGAPIRVAAPRQTRASLITLDISKTPKLDRVAPLLNTCRYIRMFGSSANELTLIASGSVDAHVDVRGTVRATDVAAALLILQEAGGVYAVDGELSADFPLTKEATMELVAASNGALLDELLVLTKAP